VRSTGLRVLLLVLTAAGFPSNPVDEAVSAALAARGAGFAESCADEVFVRRLYLDVLGTLPRPRETEAFLKSTDPDKRAALVEQLFLREEYADWWSSGGGTCCASRASFPINLWPNAVQAYHRWSARLSAGTCRSTSSPGPCSPRAAATSATRP